MNLLERNQSRVKNLSPFGLWLFIVGRVLAALGLGILAMAYYPQFVFRLGLPLLVAGIVILVIAFVKFRGAPPR